MGNMKKTFSVIVLMLFTTCCFAKQICIQILQHDESVEEVSESSLVIEDNLLNGFFDAGYIVTNSPAEVSASDGQDETLLKKGLGDAFNGFSDYFVQVKLYYESSDGSFTSKPNLEKIDLLVASAKTGVTLKSGTIRNKSKKTLDDDLYDLSLCLLTEIKKAIKA